MTEAAPQREHDLREVFNALRWVLPTGAPWRYIPLDLPPWHTVYQHTQRWIRAGCFDALVADLRALIRLGEGKTVAPTAAIFDSRTLHGTPGNGDRAGYDGHKKRTCSQIHLAVDSLGEFLAMLMTPASAQDRAQVEELAAAVQEVRGNTTELASIDQGDTSVDAATAADGQAIRLEVVKLPEARTGFVLSPRRWAVERSRAWLPRFRRLAKDDERLPETVAGLHLVAFAVLMLRRGMPLLVDGSAYHPLTRRQSSGPREALPAEG